MALLAFVVASIVANVPVTRCGAAAPHDYAVVKATVARTVAPTLKKYGIPGMAVGLTIDGRDYVFNFGVSSKTTGQRVDDATLFEIGSVTKTFTSTLTAYADVTGKLALSDDASADLPILRGSGFERVRLLHLATHTAGGLPLQFPDGVKNDRDALRYFRRWRPSHAAGTHRLYSNPSAMLLGLITSSKLGAGFASSMQRIVFEPLGLHNTFFVVPRDKLSHYAQGYSDDGKPRRLSLGPLAQEAYAIRTTAADMLRFIDANMDLRHVGDPLHRALLETHAGYYQIGQMTQDLIWEQYPYPVPLWALLQGNSEQIVFEDNHVRALRPPSSPTNDVLINKTGSTNGFGAYVAFVPGRKIGVVLLANRAYPSEARVTLAYRILTAFEKR